MKDIENVEWWHKCRGCGEVYNRAHGTGPHTACENELTRRRPKSKEELRRQQWDNKRSRMAPKVFKRDGRTCASCGCTDRLTIDHIIPITKGGSDELDNLQVLCRSCNSKKGNLT